MERINYYNEEMQNSDDIEKFLLSHDAKKITDIKIKTCDNNHNYDDYNNYDYDDEMAHNEDEIIENKYRSVEIFQIEHNQEIPVELPNGYFLEGGAARNILLNMLGEKTNPPRDIDLVAISDYHPDLSLANNLAKTYMQQDFSRGYGINEETLDQYFTTRDFILNEVAVNNNSIIFSKDALHDLKNKIIQPTEYEQNEYYSFSRQDYGLNPKLVMKALRLQTELEDLYGAAHIKNIENWQWQLKNMNLFSLALAVDKCHELGEKYATKFYFKLLEIGLADIEEDHIDSIKAESLRELTLNINFRLRNKGKRPFTFSNKHFNQDIKKDYKEEEELLKYYDILE